jgi:hypothetical protein
MTLPLPPPRQIPVVPRPRGGELSGSYLARVAQANRTDLRTFAGLLGRLQAEFPAPGADAGFTVFTLNDAAFARLLAYTGHQAGNLIRAVPSLAPRTFSAPGEPPAVRAAALRAATVDCPGCRLRRGGASLDTRLFPHKTACLRHGYWLYGQTAGQRPDPPAWPAVAAAQKRLERLVCERGAAAAMHAYRIAGGYLGDTWRTGFHPWWYAEVVGRWHDRARPGVPPAAATTAQLPDWAAHPECTALAVVFASPYWARRAVPSVSRRHRVFYQRLLTGLGVGDGRQARTVQDFAPLPGDIQEQARWGRLLCDPEWGAPPPAGAIPRQIPFIDITADYENSLRRGLPGLLSRHAAW